MDAEDRSMHLVINPRKVGGCGALTDTTEFVVDGTVAQAHPTLVCTEVRHWNATQMSANGGATHDRGVTGV